MIPAATPVYVAVAPTDLRCSFDGLAARAMGVLGHDPRAGGLFVFVNKRGNQARVLFRDKHGWCMLAKRLFRGRFKRVEATEGQACRVLDGSALVAYLDDIELGKASNRRAAAPAQPGEQHLRVVRPERSRKQHRRG
jgi:transposase